MTVDEIVKDAKMETVKDWLEKHNYTGLFSADGPCGCGLDDMGPCDQEYMGDCEPGYLLKCPDCVREGTDDCDHPESDYCVFLNKPEAT